MDKAFAYIEKRKAYIIIASCGVLAFAVNTLVFYPGYMSTDSIDQLSQAKGIVELSDWHPPIMAVVWRFLIDVTGLVSSMLVFQLAMLWAGLVLLAIYVYKSTVSIKLALLLIAAGFLPFIINISGVIWKDCHMAFALFLSAVLIFYVKEIKMTKYLRCGVLALVVLLLGYACLLRHNALFATFPLVYLAISYGFNTDRWRRAIYSMCVILSFVLIGAVSDSIMKVNASNPTSGVMVDDIVNSLSVDDINMISIGDDAKRILRDMQLKCRDKKMVLNAVSHCTNDDSIDRNLIDNHQSEIRKAWIFTILNKPISYAGFRLQAFTYFLFAPDSPSRYLQSGIIRNSLNVDLGFDRLGYTLEIYVRNFGYRYFPFLFQHWFWAITNVILLCYAWRRLAKMRLFVTMLCLSSALYLFSYIPAVIGVDYRYIYWSVFATMLAALFTSMELCSRGRKRKLRAKTKI